MSTVAAVKVEEPSSNFRNTEIEVTSNGQNESNSSTINNGSGKTSPENNGSAVNRPAYIPPHLMGRDLNNPAQDLVGTGRRVQKPRLGVKVPYRNLTSQIVSQDEIAQEILERSLRKYSYTDVPEGGDVFFAMKLTHRLANKISNSNESTPEKGVEVTSLKKKSIDAIAIKSEKLDKPTENVDEQMINQIISDSSESSLNLTDLAGNDASTVYESKADQLYAEISSTLNEECKVPKPVKIPTPTVNAPSKGNAKTLNGSITQPTEAELDNETLLAILEGTTDLNDLNISTNSTNSTPKGEIKSRKKRIKPILDPDVEKELALKQLMDFEKKKSDEKLKKAAKKQKLDEEATTGQAGAESSKGQEGDKNDASKTDGTPRKAKKNPFNYGSAPKRFPKKYQRIIKKQLRNSKLKAKTASPEQQKKLPEVPEVRIAIDRYIKTYANKRKLKPDIAENPEKKSKEENVQQPETVPEDKITEAQEAEQPEDINLSIQEEVKENESPATNVKPKANSKVMREINRLLGDEGAINMIYSIEQKRLPDSRRDANVLPSLRRKKKDLLLKTKLVKNAVLRLSMSPSQVNTSRVRRTSPDIPKDEKVSTSPSRKASIESVESNISDHSPKNRKVAAEASRIIRRHSSSSAYSSDEEDHENKGKSSQSPTAAEAHVGVTKSSKSGSESRRVSAESATASEKAKDSGKHAKGGDKDTNAERKDAPAISHASAAKRRESKEDKHEGKTQADIAVPDVSIEIPGQLSLKEITVRRYDNLVQIILISSSTKMKNAVNVQVLNELTNVLRELQKDENCRTVLVTSTGSSFCQGIDLQALICSDKAERSKIVKEYVTALLNFTKRLSQFPKILIAGVHGSAVGLGVTMLPFFDMVFASDKATFYTPYVKLGQIPEAGATLTLPHLLGNAVTSELLFGCRMLTATEALQFGLVTRILWPNKFTEELLPLARSIAGHSSQAMVSTKLLLRQTMNAKLEEQLKTESDLLTKHWCSEECQDRFKDYLRQEALLQNN